MTYQNAGASNQRRKINPAANSGNKRRHNSPARRRDHDRDQVDDRTVRKPDLPHEKEQYRRQRRDQGQGEEYGGQLFADGIEDRYVIHGQAGGAVR